jgi:hypothetical protein
MENSPEAEKAHVEGDGFGTGNTSTPTNEANCVAEKDHAALDGSHLENGLSGDLSSQHKEYLIARHGTTDLEPLPTMDPADPLNWPAWKVYSQTSTLQN